MNEEVWKIDGDLNILTDSKTNKILAILRAVRNCGWQCEIREDEMLPPIIKLIPPCNAPKAREHVVKLVKELQENKMSKLKTGEWLPVTRENLERIELGADTIVVFDHDKVISWNDWGIKKEDLECVIQAKLQYEKWFIVLPKRKTKAETLTEKLLDIEPMTYEEIKEIIESVYGKEI